jgi:hypothetical protein
MMLTIRHFARSIAQRDGAPYYYPLQHGNGPKPSPCAKCGWLSPRITETDECLSCKLETFVTLRRITIGRGGLNARCVFSINTSRRMQEVFRDWPRTKAWVDQYLGRTKH